MTADSAGSAESSVSPDSSVDGEPGESRVLVEICVDDLDGALAADAAGAERIELCADLLEGGTTPSPGLIRAVLSSMQTAGVQVIVRPRGGDFVYSEAELDVMCLDLEAIVALARTATTPVGVVLGALRPSGEIDDDALRRLVAAAGPLPVTFHKAFDQTPDLIAAYGTLRDCGVRGVLTSGGPHPALEGVDTLASLVALSQREPDAPTVLVGGSVRAANVNEIIRATGAREVHLRAQSPSPRGDGTLVTDPEVIGAVLEAIGRPRVASGVVTARVATDRVVTAVRPATEGDPSNDGEASMVVIALDIGGTNLKAAIVDASGRAILAHSIGVQGLGDELTQTIIGLLTDVRAHAERDGHTVVGIGVVTPGMVEADKGIVRYASTLGWTDVPLGPILSSALGLPVQIGHDVRSSGLAEALYGASAGVADSVLVAIGTGVAASILSDGHPVAGAVTTAGELGHIPAIPGGEPCTCGQRGCLEVYLSGAGLARRYAAAGGLAGLDARAISLRLGEDEIADRVWADGVRALALGLASVTLLIDPSVIVLAGGVSRAGDALLTPLRAELRGLLAWREAPEIRTSALGTSGGRIGAAILAFRASGHSHMVDGWSIDDVLAEPTSRLALNDVER
ncbi:copper homeostasis protein CutC [Agreia bicolorata]|uniref:copper homeostasis protein CutC n=1 Tax=Agreia bicolorata TaxID=110935 RepID=UPI000B30C409|nr:copper homeostasis protein CutC [Agreia bicolorata]